MDYHISLNHNNDQDHTLSLDYVVMKICILLLILVITSMNFLNLYITERNGRSC